MRASAAVEMKVGICLHGGTDRVPHTAYIIDDAQPPKAYGIEDLPNLVTRDQAELDAALARLHACVAENPEARDRYVINVHAVDLNACRVSIETDVDRFPQAVRRRCP